MGHLTLVLGGAASGKSAYAESLACATGTSVVYLATGSAGDDETRARIERHRARRPSSWTTVECADLAPAELSRIAPAATLLVDSLTAHLAAELLRDEAALLAAYDAHGRDALEPALARARAFLELVAQREGATILTSDEVGQGIVPPTALGRAFRDLIGEANQLASRAAARAVLVVAGRPLELGPCP
jgi:adenosylcobinamide kinase/adenosylcobinamide-phosphate guanylyltransferase